MQVTTLSGTGRGYRDGQLEQAMFAVPTGCACDPEGNVYIADQMNHRIRKVVVDGVVSTFAGDGIAGQGRSLVHFSAQ
jgi:secreted PhoX family phosphatase